MSRAIPRRRKVRHPYIIRKKGVCSGKPVIAGTRMKVTQIAIEHEKLGWTADQIIDAHPSFNAGTGARCDEAWPLSVKG